MPTKYTPISNAMGVYLIRFTGSEYVYIGSTSSSFRKRRYQHIYQLQKNTHPNRHLRHAFKLYGVAELEFIILEVVDDPSQIVSREQYWMDAYRGTHQLYNILPEAGTTRGRVSRPLTNAEKENLRTKLIGRKATEERKQKQRDGWTPEVKAKFSARVTGKKMSEASIEKLRLRMTGNAINLNRTKRTYEGFESPEGVAYRNITSLKVFCQEHKLIAKRMVSVATGKALSHRGWTLIGADRSLLRPRKIGY